MTFPFRPVHLPRLGMVRRPIIPAIVSGPTGVLSGAFLIDSGADVSLIPHALGSRLGLSDEGVPRGLCRGIGKGIVPYSLCAVGLQVGQVRLRVRVGWCMAEGFPPVLGRLDVFDLLDIDFRQSANCLVVRPAGAQTA